MSSIFIERHGPLRMVGGTSFGKPIGRQPVFKHVAKINPSAVDAIRAFSNRPFTSPQMMRVIGVLKEYEFGLTVRDIAELLRLAANYVHKLIQTLLTQGLIVSPGRVPGGRGMVRQWKLA